MTITIIAPPQADAAAPAPGNRPGVAHIDPNMKLVTGTFCSASEDWFEEPLERGLRLILVQSGQLRCRIPGQPEHLIEGPSLCTIANDGDFTSAQIYGTDKPLRHHRPARRRSPGQPPRLAARATDTPLRRRSADHELPGAAGDAGVGLADRHLPDARSDPRSLPRRQGPGVGRAQRPVPFRRGAPVEEPRITCSEVERIHAARDLLVGALQEPPSLDTLASRVGMNPRKLTAGFRKVFGASVFGYLQEYRLREAHRMLCDEEANVSTVAYRVATARRISPSLSASATASPQRDPLSLRDDPDPATGGCRRCGMTLHLTKQSGCLKHCRPGLPGK